MKLMQSTVVVWRLSRSVQAPVQEADVARAKAMTAILTK
jgi:hypothetical protein